MSRELKFRAWDTIDKEWLFGYELLGGFSLLGEVTLMGELNEISLMRWNDVEIMQFTGLKDKNGVEVYESDILPLPEGATARAGWVEFFEGAFVFAAKEPRTGDTLRTLLAELLIDQPS